MSTQDALISVLTKSQTRSISLPSTVNAGSRMSFQKLSIAFLVTCVGVSFVGSTTYAQEAANTKAQAVSNTHAGIVAESVIHPGDHLKITVISDDKDLSGEFEVAPDGTLKHPLYNQIVVAGVPVSALKETIASFLRKFQKEPQLEVEPLFKVAINGEVLRPGVFYLSPETAVRDAIEAAGGTTDRANANAITLLRNDTKISVRLDDGTRMIQSGDRIGIPAKRNTIANITPFVGIGASLISLTVLIISHHR
jgi:protein involved in polysaccharide export with SLBB domain